MMGKKLSLNIFLRTVVVLLCLITASSFQEKPKWELLLTAPTAPVDKVSLDPYSQIYISDNKGSIYRYDTLGNLLQLYSPGRKGPVALLEASRNINTFLFYQNFQKVTFLGRLLTELSTTDFDREKIGFARLATFSLDNNLWVIDDRDFSLKKYNTGSRKLMIKSPLDLLIPPGDYQFSFMKEYQNLLFVSDRNTGIYIFDNFGNYSQKIPVQGAEYFNFYNNKLYFLHEDFIHFIDIYTGKITKIPAPQKGYKQVLLDRNKVILFREAGMDIYRMPPAIW